MPPTLKNVLTFRGVFSKPDMLMIGPTKGSGIRGAAPLASGFLRGDGFEADLVTGSSDWPRIDEEAGVAHLDARIHFRDSTTGDTFYMTEVGIMEVDEQFKAALAWSSEAKSTKAGESKWFATIAFEVSNEKHKWMERNWFISQGHWHVPGDGSAAAEHDIYMVVSG